LESIRITTLADNYVFKSGFLGQWGLSFLVEAKDGTGRTHKIVFDTAAIKESVLYNIKKLGIDLSDLEYIVLSHGHKDHTATTVELLRMSNRNVKVVTHPHLFLPKFTVAKDGRRVEGGPPEGEASADIEKAGGQLVMTDKPLKLFPGAYTTGQIPRVTDFEMTSPPARDATAKRFTVVGGKTVPDLLLDDQGLVMNVNKLGPTVIAGCSHAGLVNTVLQARKLAGSEKVYGIIGGFHLLQHDNSHINRTIRELRNFGFELISPCHCTGFEATCALYRAFPKEFILNSSGRTIEAGTKTELRLA
jgi:7,8-dihydropterin-6-yl-methyl-4-(beta-D-ribofuranosyl)aminobenzene 5'-phosphate synthase